LGKWRYLNIKASALQKGQIHDFEFVTRPFSSLLTLPFCNDPETPNVQIVIMKYVITERETRTSSNEGAPTHGTED